MTVASTCKHGHDLSAPGSYYRPKDRASKVCNQCRKNWRAAYRRRAAEALRAARAAEES